MQGGKRDFQGERGGGLRRPECAGGGRGSGKDLSGEDM